MSVTVRDALQLDSYKGCRLIAGEKGLHNIILYTDSMEVPDIKPWLRPNLLMITTGYSIGKSQETLQKLVLDLHAAGSAGLAIKTKFIGDIGSDIIASANRLNLPIIVIPDDMPTSALYVPLMNLVYSDQNIKLQSHYFLIDIMNGDIHSEEEARLRTQAMQWPALPLRLLLFHVSDQRSSGNEEILRECLRRSSPAPEKYVLLSNNEHLILIISDFPSVLQINTFCRKLCSQIRTLSGLPARCGISDPIFVYTALSDGFKDALDAIKIGKIEQSDDAVFFIRDFRLEQGLLKIKGDPQFKKCAADMFTNLKEYDQKHNTNLLSTLKVLTSALGSKVLAAESLFIHRNTMAYRIKKIEELTGLDLSDNNTILHLSFLFKIEPYL